MQGIFKIPARVTTVDYIGVPNDAATKYRRRALSELGILKEHMEFNNLKQCRRYVTVDTGVKISCHILFGEASATVVIGSDSSVSIDSYACFCTAYGVLAGRILELHDEKEDEDDVTKHYVNDLSYAADIKVCQKSGTGTPKRIETRLVSEAMGVKKEEIKAMESSEFHISDTFFNIPFTDRYKHAPGELVLILAMPLVDYRPEAPTVYLYDTTYTKKEGSWSPEVNKRRITTYYWSDTDVSPKAQITARYTASTGLTHMLTLDSNIWDTLVDSESDTRPTEELAKERRLNPFRILPVPMGSCFTGYK